MVAGASFPRAGGPGSRRAAERTQPGPEDASLERPTDGGPGDLRLTLVAAGPARPLSELVPLLEKMGLTVLREQPFRVRPSGITEQVWIRDLEMFSRDAIDLERYVE